MAGDDDVAEAFDSERPFESTLDEDVSPVGLVAPASQQTDASQRVEGTGNDRLCDAELLRQSANRMGRRLKVDGEKHRHLALGQILIVVADEVESDVVPQTQRLTRPEIGGHIAPLPG